MLTCPHCEVEVRIKELPYQGYFKSFRICPNCEGSFVVDKDTKIRQAIFFVIATISLVTTTLLYLKGTDWLIPTIVSNVTLGVFVYWANKRVSFVPYEKE
jgi:hypothetical protein